MPVDIDIDECSVTAYLSGEIDHHSAAELRSTIDEAVEHAYPEVLVLGISEESRSWTAPESGLLWVGGSLCVIFPAGW